VIDAARRVIELAVVETADQSGWREPPPIEAYEDDARLECIDIRNAPAKPPLCAVPMSDFATADLPLPDFVVERIVPRGFVTLLAGHGDTGKTLLALTMAAHIASGRRFAELTCVTGRVLFVSLEDSGELVRLRLRRIAEAYELDSAAVAAGVSVLVAGDTDDCALAREQAEAGARRLAFTAALDQIMAAAAGFDMIVIDNASDAFDANESERRLVRRFVRALQRIGREHDAAVLLLAHVDKAGAKYGTSGETYSGSTAWHNSVRSRLALSTGASGLELVHEKSNLCKKLDRSIVLEPNEHGVPMPLSNAERDRNERADVRAVLAAIRGAEADEVVIPTARTGPSTVAHVLAGRAELSDTLADDSKRINDAVRTLEREGAIVRERYRDAHRKEKVRWKCASSPRS
jgi:KaiC/GvpD/RAD55 family RecA-like ATPase